MIISIEFVFLPAPWKSPVTVCVNLANSKHEKSSVSAGKDVGGNMMSSAVTLLYSSSPFLNNNKKSNTKYGPGER